MDKSELSRKILSDITVYSKYAKYIPGLKRRETWEEIVTRNMEMHIKKFPSLEQEIKKAYEFVYAKKVVPSMRALEDSTPIMTKYGWKLAKDIQEGDILYSSEGTETKVLGVTHFHDKELYQISFNDDSHLVACSEHLWIVKTNDDLKYDKAPRVVDTKFIKDYYSRSHKGNIYIHNPKPIQRDSVELHIDPYILGLWLGNGHSNGTQYATEPADMEFMAEQYIKTGFKIQPADVKNKYAFNVIGLKPMLAMYSLETNKHIPRIYMQGSIDQRIGLVQGLMDTNGSCVGGRYLFRNTNMALIAGFKELLSSLGIQYIERVSKVSTISFLTELPVFRLPKKLETLPKLIKADEEANYRTVSSVKYIGTGNATCFHVDSNDNSFLAGDRMIVTHNSMQFAGKPMEIAPSRSYNCSYMAVDDLHAFSEAMFLLLGGSGVGYSVQSHHVEKLPVIHKPIKKRRYLVGDSIEGWADAVKALIRAYLDNKTLPDFDFRDIRPKGARLITSGGKAPGPEPLKDCLHNIQKILDRKPDGSKLTPLECHDIMCYIADAVLAGGIRRAAMISLFSLDDEEMLTCKYNHWYELNPQRARANNSVVLLRHRMKEKEFKALWKKIQISNTGEPGIFWTNDKELGINPSLRAGTRIMTKDGVKNIESLEGKSFEVKNLYGKYAPAKCFLSGRGKSLYKITLENGKEYYCTPEHKWPVLVNRGWNKSWEKKETTELKAGMRLPFLTEDSMFDGQLGDADDGFLIGWLYGDGWIADGADDGVRQYGLVVSQKDAESGILEKIKTILANKISPEIHFTLRRNGDYEANFQGQSAREYFDKFGVEHKSFGLPKVIWENGSEAFRKGFVDGLLSAGSNAGHIRSLFYSSYVKLVEDLRDMFGFYGIKTSITSQTTRKTLSNGGQHEKDYTYYHLNINAESINHFNYLFKLTHKEKDSKLKSFKDNNIQFFQRNIRIKSVEITDIKEDVWDISVYDETHCFQLSNCVTGNCSEISLKSNQMCVAGNTPIITKTGIVPIEEAVNQKIEIWNGKNWATVTPFQTGTNDVLYRVSLSDGSYLDVTGNHKWLVKHRFQKEYSEVTTDQLRSLLKNSKYPLSVPRANVLYDAGGTDEPLAYDYGYALGDGSIGSLKSYKKTDINRIPHHFNELRIELCRMLKWHDSLPREVFSWSKKSILFFMAGWIDADGSQANRGCRLYGKKGQLRDAQLLLTKCGIQSSLNICAKADSRFTTIAEKQIRRKQDLWYLHIPNVSEIPSHRLALSEGCNAKYKGKNQVVKSITRLPGTHKSFCLTEPETHQCLFGNVLTKQCNLTEVNVSDVNDQAELNERCKAAAFIGTLQASYTDFHYLRDTWKKNCEKDALLGVSMTGICSGGVLKLNIEEAANICVEENIRVAKLININRAARVTCIKPSGTTSLVFGCSSGIHEWHSQYYIRRMRVGKNEALYRYLIKVCPDLVEDDALKPSTQAVISIPQKAPEGAITLKNSTPIQLLERVKKFADEWITPGHYEGDNHHNVSVTVSLGPNDWDEAREWLWKNRNCYTGITVLPLNDHTYVQMPFEECTEETYEKMLRKVKDINLSEIIEDEDNTALTEQAACAGGACAVTHV